MDRRQFFAAFFGALSGGLVVEATRAAADASVPRLPYESPKLTYLGKIDLPEWYGIGGWTRFDETGRVIESEITEVSRCGEKMRIRRTLHTQTPIEFVGVTVALR